MKTEPYGYFRVEPFGWTDCAETDEGAIPLYEHEDIARLEAQRDELIAVLQDVISWVPGRPKWHTDEPIKAVERARSVMEKLRSTK